ncbi:DNA-binding transcriptional LysR family regulator [Prauserella isguenensis]|uniref:DNA-binding transcriptional LysR family regulator n=1 Tax=Prauserella isguenensis TaxID=1470180 RepID=A0A839S4Y7_9PSEU|nr:LysR family transcriptional regulator [Prauserella isguenensis]MBB3052865.1 DNA-binding transcriptional LysR family regulator [Prauserella isguenensis]
MLDVAKLRLLRAVIATGSIRSTAASLGYTPSAVSQQLAALQRDTGLRLFDRVGRGIEPTSAGRTLASEAEQVFSALSALDGVVGDLRAGRVGSLSIGYFASAGATWLPPVVAALQSEFPELRLDLRMTEQRDGLELPDIDLFVDAPGIEHPGHADVHPIVDDPFLAVVQDTDPLASRDEVPLAELADRRWVDNDLHRGTCRRALLDACAEAGFSPKFAVETHDYQTAIPFVGTGIGITVVPRLGIGDLPPGLTTVRLVSPEPVRNIAVSVKQTVADHPAAVRALEVLRAVAAP